MITLKTINPSLICKPREIKFIRLTADSELKTGSLLPFLHVFYKQLAAAETD
jgi:hypothetical protein